MAIEYEVQVLDIDENEVKNKLKEIGAEFEGSNLMKRWVFNMSHESQEWIRLRDDGNKITVTYKKRGATDIGKTEEIEIIVNDFEKTADILNKLSGFTEKYYQENKRAVYRLGEIEFSIDSWPKIPSYLEIESTDEDNVRKGLKLLGLGNHTYGDFGGVKIYEKYGLDLHSFEILKF